MVACPHALASAAGVDMLRSGGSAVDAAIAAASALAVLYPHMCSIGGDACWLIYDAGANKVSYLDGGGRAAAAATLERFAGQAEIPFRGLAPATLTTPGAVASFCEAHARHGRLPLARCLQDAIYYAAEGCPVSARVSRWIEQTAPETAEKPPSSTIVRRLGCENTFSLRGLPLGPMTSTYSNIASTRPSPDPLYDPTPSPDNRHGHGIRHNNIIS